MCGLKNGLTIIQILFCAMFSLFLQDNSLEQQAAPLSYRVNNIFCRRTPTQPPFSFPLIDHGLEFFRGSRAVRRFVNSVPQFERVGICFLKILQSLFGEGGRYWMIPQFNIECHRNVSVYFSHLLIILKTLRDKVQNR